MKALLPPSFRSRLRSWTHIGEAKRAQRRLDTAREAFTKLMKERLGSDYSIPNEAPLPPKELLLKTTASFEGEFEQRFRPGSTYPLRYAASNYENWPEWFGYLERHGFDLSKVSSIFELGCGSAPVLRHLRGIKTARLVASDVNPDMIEWCRVNVPGPDYHQNELSPPLSFLNDGEIDFTYSYSVFTHIPLDMQSPWIHEVSRILRPGGWCLCSVLGARHRSRFLNAEQLSEFEKKGRLELSSSSEGASLATQVGGSKWDTYQSSDEIRKNFGEAFEVLEYLETRNQDLLLLRKP